MIKGSCVPGEMKTVMTRDKWQLALDIPEVEPLA